MQIIKDVEIIGRKTWSDFVLKHPNGNIFQTPELYDVYLKTDLYEPIVLFAIHNDLIEGVLLAVIQKEYSGIFGYFTSRSIIWGGPLVYTPEVACLLITHYNEIINRKAIYSQFRNIFACDSIKNSFEIAEFEHLEHLDILIDLTKSEEKLWADVHKNRQKEIKNGFKKGLVIQKIDISTSKNLNEIYACLKKLYSRIGLPLPSYSFFQNAFYILEPLGLQKTFIATLNEKLVGFRIVLTYKGMIYDWYAASDDHYLNCRPNDVLPWEIIKWGSKNGYKVFDFGGAGKPDIPYGVREYKLKFGGDLVNFGRFEKIHQKSLFRLIKTGFSFWQRLNFNV